MLRRGQLAATLFSSPAADRPVGLATGGTMTGMHKAL